MPWLYDHANPATRRRTRVTVDAETSLPLIVSSQDTGPILDSAKALASSFDPIKPRTGLRRMDPRRTHSDGHVEQA